MSSRDIEGENPLYLPQAKVYDGACALGPWVVPAESIVDPYNLRIACSIARDGRVVWQDETNTRQLHRKLDELVSYLGRSTAFRPEPSCSPAPAWCRPIHSACNRGPCGDRHRRPGHAA